MTQNPPIKVLLVDDNQIQNEGLIKLFNGCEKIDFRGCLTSPESCLSRIASDRYIDILMVDVRFPKSPINGLQLVEKVRQIRPYRDHTGKVISFRIVFFSIEEAGFVRTEIGVHGTIPKDEAFSNIVSMLEMTHKHGATFDPKKPSNPREEVKFFYDLTDAEREVFCGVMRGLKTKEIAKERKPKPEEINHLIKLIHRKIRNAGFRVDEIHDPKIVALIEQKETKQLKLNNREIKIVRLLASGKSPASLPDALRPIQSVNVQRKKILEKIKHQYPDVEKIDDFRIFELAKKHGLCPKAVL